MAGIGSGGNHPFDPNFKRIFVGGLAGHTRDETLKDYFMRFGDVEEAFVLYDERSGNSKRYGFVEFADHLSAVMACRCALPIIDGKLVDCKEALPRGVLPPQRSNYVNYRHHRAEVLSILFPSRGRHLHSPSPPIPRNPIGYGPPIRHEYPNIMTDSRFLEPGFNPISHPYYEMPQQPSPSHGINFSLRYSGSSSGGGQSWSSAVQVRAAPFVVGVTAPSNPITPQYPTGGNLRSSFQDATSVHTRPHYYEDPFPYRIWFDP